MRCKAYIAIVLIMIAAICCGASTPREEDNPDIFGSLYSENAEAAAISQDNPSSGTQSPVSSVSLSQQFRIKAESFVKQDTRELHLNNPIDYIVRVSWQGRLGDVMVESPDAPELTNLRSTYVIPSNRTSPETGAALAEFNYILEPTAKGDASIGPVSIRYRIRSSGEEGTLKTSRLDLHVLGARVAWGKIIGRSAALLVLVGAGFAGIFLGRNLLRRRAPGAMVEPPVSPYERIFGEIDSMKMMLVEEELKDFYDKVFELVRGALAQRSGSSFQKYTAQELAEYLAQDHLPEHSRNKALSILERCNTVRFGGYLPTYAENEEILKDLKAFVESESEAQNHSAGGEA
jgi:hypothetical protein